MALRYSVVALPLADLVAIYSSRDDALMARMAAPQNEWVARLLDKMPAAREAIFAILVGSDLLRGQASHYAGYAVEAICFELGQSLGVIDNRSVWRVEDHLAKQGASLELFPDVTVHWPVPIPDTVDFPLVGVLSKEQIAERHAALSSLCYEHDDSLEAIALEIAQRLFAKGAQAGTEAIVFFH
jgi:hypothetical protein